jgi:hypothetical protein
MHGRLLTAALLGARAYASSQHALLPADALGITSALYSLSPPPQLVAIVTGGGTQIAPWLLATPGASSTVLELSMPYSHASLASMLGTKPERS